MVTHMHLIARYASDGVVRCTDLGGIGGEGGDVITRQGRSIGKERSRQLHSVAGIAGKADNEVIFINYLIF